ncbi:MAG: multiheme c-type cytochrome [Melioribacteraceae bacterium]
MKKVILSLAVSIVFLLHTPAFSQTDDAKLSAQSQECLDCHLSVTPGIAGDWQKSLHSKTSPREAAKKTELEKRISVTDISKIENSSNVVGCYECHSLNGALHKDNFEHFGYKINIVVSPNDCNTCHPIEVAQYAGSKKANAHYNLASNSVYNLLVETLTNTKEYLQGKIIHGGRNNLAIGETCNACHGTEIKVDGKKTVQNAIGDVEVPKLLNWPNQGVGRINPDGSLGACTPCHPRHSFLIDIARKPYTCGQCHLEPDVPAYNIYKESKHGNIYDSKESEMNYSSVPWVVGKDINAPTCATCHNSLLVNGEGEVLAQRSHDFSDRLWVRIFGLVYSHPQPKSGKTYEIKNADGLPLPATFGGKISSDYLIDSNEQSLRKDKMKSVCLSCHSTGWTEGQLDKIEKINVETDKMVLASTKILLEGWEKGAADKTNPFDEELELMWQNQWLLYANSIRHTTAMMGPDYGAFKNGWYESTRNLELMKNFVKVHSAK